MNQRSPLGDKKKFALNLTLFGALIALTFVVLLWGSDLPALWAVIRRANPLYLLLGLLCMFAFVSCEACNTHLVLGSLGKKLSFGHCLQSACVGFYFSSITPSATGGQPAQVYYMQRDKVPLSLASLNFLLITVCYQAVMLGYGGAMFLLQRDFVSQNVKGIGILLVYGIAVNGLCIVGITCAMFSHKLVRRCGCASTLRRPPPGWTASWSSTARGRPTSAATPPCCCGSSSTRWPSSPPSTWCRSASTRRWGSRAIRPCRSWRCRPC